MRNHPEGKPVRVYIDPDVFPRLADVREQAKSSLSDIVNQHFRELIQEADSGAYDKETPSRTRPAQLPTP
jgi:hypothetical protein